MTPRAAGAALVLAAAGAAAGLPLLPLFVVAAAAWLAALPGRRRLGPWFVLAVAVLIRVPFLGAPYFSNDLHRYAWEGRVQNAGENPYEHAPDAPELAHLRGPDHHEVQHAHLTTIYPPLAQFAFRAVTAAGGGVRGLRAVFVFLDVLVVVLLLRWLAATGRPPGEAILFAWCPVAVCGAGVGHLDPLMLVFLVGAGWAWERGRATAAAACLAGAVLAKTMAVLLLPWFLLRRPKATLLGFVPLVALGYLPFLGGDLFGTLFHFGADFAFNGSLHRVFAWLAPDAARPLLAALLVLWTGAVAVAQPRVAAAGALVFAGLLLLSPTVHFWYLSWFLVLLPAAGGGAWRWPLAVWGASVGFSGLTYAAHYLDASPFTERFPLTAVEYALPALVAAVLLWRRRPRRRPPLPPGPPWRARFAVVIPCRGEAENLRGLLPRWRASGAARVIVADTPTGDGTEALAADDVYVPVRERGYGAAVRAGWRAAGDVDFLVVADADHDPGPAQVDALLAPFRDPAVGLVTAARPADAEDLSWPQRLGNAGVTLLIALGWGRWFHDLGPFRAVRLAAWGEPPRDPGFGWNVEMNVRALERGMDVVEVALPPGRRRAGRNLISGTWSGVARAGWGMLRRLYLLREESCRRPSSS